MLEYFQDPHDNLYNVSSARTSLCRLDKAGKSRGTLPFFDLLCVLFCIFYITCRDYSHDPILSASKGYILGKIMDSSDDSPLVGVRITTEPFTQALASNSRGMYVISETDTGNFSIFAEYEGYNSCDTVLYVKAGVITLCNIKMEKKVNHSPAIPQLISPANHAKSQNLTVSLNWTSSDPDGDSLFYDVYMDTTSSPVKLVASNLPQNLFVVSGLDSAKTYYWCVKAQDGLGLSSDLSTVYSFSTLGKMVILINESFESYAVNTFPSSGGWILQYNGAGNSYQGVTNKEAHWGNKSLQVLGTYSWCGTIYNYFSYIPQEIFFEGWIKTMGSDNLIAYNNGHEGSWGNAYATIYFGSAIECHIGSSSQSAQSYTTNRWYKIKMQYDSKQSSISVWIDDILRVKNLTGTVSGVGYANLQLQSGWGGNYLYCDDIKVWYYE